MTDGVIFGMGTLTVSKNQFHFHEPKDLYRGQFYILKIYLTACCVPG